MFFCFKNHKIIVPLLVFFILIGCKLQDSTNTHGIVFLKNRSDKLIINTTNKNDVLKIIGQPHSKSINNKNEWFYIERTLAKGKFHKLGKNVLKTNNVLVLTFDKYGILENKFFLNKNDKNQLKFSENTTKNELTKKSFIEKFLSSVKEKMYGRK